MRRCTIQAEAALSHACTRHCFLPVVNKPQGGDRNCWNRQNTLALTPRRGGDGEGAADWLQPSLQEHVPRGGGAVQDNLDPAPLRSRYHHMIGEQRFPAVVRDRGPPPDQLGLFTVLLPAPLSHVGSQLRVHSPAEREHPGTWTSLLFTIGRLVGACPAGRLTSDWLGFTLERGGNQGLKLGGDS